MITTDIRPYVYQQSFNGWAAPACLIKQNAEHGVTEIWLSALSEPIIVTADGPPISIKYFQNPFGGGGQLALMREPDIR